jgi:hypothetical protein
MMAILEASLWAAESRAEGVGQAAIAAGPHDPAGPHDHTNQLWPSEADSSHTYGFPYNSS